MVSARCLRTSTVVTVLAALLAGPCITSSAVAATVAPQGGPLAAGDDPVLGDENGPVPVQAVARPLPGRPTAGVRIAAVPTPAVNLPSTVDARPPYVGQTSCDPFIKPGAKAFGDLMLATYGIGSYGSARLCHLDGTSEHKEGRAVDWMLSAANPTHAAVADSVLGWLTAQQGANARRLGVMYLIWNRKMWRAYAPERGWQPYSGSSPHTDHIHISLTWDGALKRTSWWSAAATTASDQGPCRVYAGQYAPLYTRANYARCTTALPAAPPSTQPVYVYGQSAPAIATAQRALGVLADGQFGQSTRQALLSWQAKQGVPRTGVLDNASWARLGVSPGQPAPAPVPFSAPAPAPAPPTSTRSTAPSSVVTALTRYKRVRLGWGSRGPAVRALQRALRAPAESRYRTATRRAVVALQRRTRLPQTGVTDVRTWNRAEEFAYPWVGHRNTVLRRGSRGAAVIALQRALRVTPDGAFGPVTAAAVAALQAGYGLPADGVVSRSTWLAIIAAASN